MTEKELRSRAVEIARAWLGKKEADGSHREILDIYNRISPLPRGYRMKETDPWCAAFVSAVGAAAGLSDVILPECSCDYMAAAYRGRGSYKDRSYHGQPGDLIFYNWDGDKSLDHVGIIEELLQGGYLIIEGNKSDAVGRRSIPGDWTLIAGIACPEYAGAADEQPATPAAEPLMLPLLRRSDRGECVRAMQAVLIARGFGCGPDGADGDFGPNTKRAVELFQASYALPVTGECDASTWKKLLGFA